MHELAICQSLLRAAERAAVANGSSEVTRIVAAVGPLSGVEAGLLARAFTVAREGTIAARAVLEIETIPVIVRCTACAAETAVAANALICGRCRTWRVELKSGDELLLKSVELAVGTGPAGDNECANIAAARQLRTSFG